METLTKENFWDEMEQKYPKAMAHFRAWIDAYKIENSWDGLFNAGIAGSLYYKDEDLNKHYQEIETVAPKYHELPIAMQFGIFLQFMEDFLAWLPVMRAISSKGSLEPRDIIPDSLKYLEKEVKL